MRRTFLKTTLLLTIFFLLSLSVSTVAQSEEIFTLTADQLQNGQALELDKLGWKYSPGDEPRFADPQFDDRTWETLSGTILTLDNIPKSGWSGIGWFRLRVKIDDALVNHQLALIMDHWGASEVYVDGKLINRFGKVGTTVETEEAFRPNKIPVLFDFHGNRSEHLIAVRHSVVQLRDDSSFRSWYLRKHLHNLGMNGNPNGAGVMMRLGESENTFVKHEAGKIFVEGNRFWRVGLILMIGILFLLLYVFYPNRRVNLYFSIFALNLVAFTVCVYLRDATHYGLLTVETADFYAQSFLLSGNIFLLVFLYTAFGKCIPKHFWVLVAITVGQVLTFLIFSRNYVEAILWSSALLFFMVESLRIVITALNKKQSGALIVGVGIALFVSIPLFNIALILNFVFGTGRQLPLSSWFLAIVRQLSTLGATVPIAIYLARQFAQTNKTLEAQLIKEVEHEREKSRFAIVEAENERRAAELEEARQLQLSMLPKKLPDLPHLDIAAYMKTASEVGGDYYDFHLGDDGTLTIAVGDATGHGLKAGTMVASVKSLFVSLAYHPDISHIFHRMSRVLKEMKLRGLFMAMTMVKMKDYNLSVSIAGMPPVWIYRGSERNIEEVMMRALPLGGITNYQYHQQEFAVSSGDIIVLMSDGLPERFNSLNEMLEDESAQKFITENAQLSAQEIINGLVKLGDDWGGVRPQDDDVTFVVVKVKE